MKTVNTLLSATIAATLFSAQAVASDHNEANTAAMDHHAENTWLTVSGEITRVNEDTFTLKSADQRIEVSFGDNDGDADAQIFEVGNTATVSGQVDKNLFTNTQLEASSVFVHDWSTTFVADPADVDARDRYIATAIEPANLDDMTVIGTVSDVNGEVVELTTAGLSINVDTSELPGTPLDEDGFLHIQEGDRVKVDATIESKFFNESMVVADTIVRLNDVSDESA